MADRQLMHQVCGMSEMDKDALICRLFGFIEILEEDNESATADDLRSEIEKSVKHSTK